MFKNYMLINIFLGCLLIFIIAMIISNFNSPVEENIDLPTISVSETDGEEPKDIINEQSSLKKIDHNDYSDIHMRNLFHPDRIVPPTQTPEPREQEQVTPTPQQLDCDNTQIKLSGIVSIENEKPYCFLTHPQETGSDVTVYFLDDKVGDYTISDIGEDSITIASNDGKSCEIFLFDFSDEAMKQKAPARPTSRQRPTPPRGDRRHIRPTPRRHGISR